MLFVQICFRVDVSCHVLGRGKTDDGVMKVGAGGEKVVG